MSVVAKGDVSRAALSALVFALLAAPAPAAREPLTILYTGETHAMLTPSDSPYRPEGGLARRASVVARERAKGAVLLVDAGGWAAGGLYDEYTEGAEVDTIRTEAAARAMAAMRYDAIALSDEELAWGPEAVRRWREEHRLPFISANLFDAETGERLAPAFRIIERGGWRGAVIGVTPGELDLVEPEVARRYKLTDPVEAARRAATEARLAGAESLVCLSPLGEEMSERLAREVEKLDLVINAGRRPLGVGRGGQERGFRAGSTLVGQFDFQGRSMNRARLTEAPGGAGAGWRRARRLPHIVLCPKVPDDPAVAAVVSEARTRIEHGARRVLRIELFKMSLCPYLEEVERTVAEIVEALPDRVEVDVTHVIRTDEKAGFRSRHGKSETEEAKRQVAIFRYSPEKYWAYCAWRSKNLKPSRSEEAGWEKACRRLGVDAARVKEHVTSGESDAILRRHAYRTQRLRLWRSPFLYIRGRMYEGGMRRLEILHAVRSRLPGGLLDKDKGLRIFEGVPECFSDADCRKPGFVGECENPGTKRARRVYYEAVKVGAVIVEDPDAIHSPVERILSSLRVFLPGLEERLLDYDTPEGRRLVERYEIKRLPAYIIDKAALEERSVGQLKGALVPTKDRLVLAPHLAGSHQDITRPDVAGPIDLFISPHSEAAADAVKEALDFMERKRRRLVRLRSAVWRNADGKLAALGGVAEIEAMLREIAVGEVHPGLLHRYLRARLRSPGSSYWRDPLLGAGIDPEEIRRFAEGDRALALLDADAQELAGLKADGPVVLVVKQETVPVISRAQFRHMLEAPDDLREDPPRDSRAKRAVQLLVRALEDAVVQRKPAARERILRGLKALSE